MNNRINIKGPLSMHLDKLENVINQTHKYDKLDVLTLKVIQFFYLKKP